MDGKFTLEIDMGNDAMRSSKSLALALESVANKIRHGIKLPARGPGVTEEKILDGNGNTVGAWHYVEEK